MKSLFLLVVITLAIGCTTGPEKRADEYDRQINEKRAQLEEAEKKILDLQNLIQEFEVDDEEVDTEDLDKLKHQLHAQEQEKQRLKDLISELKSERTEADELAKEARAQRQALFGTIASIILVGVKTLAGGAAKMAATAA